MNTNEPLFISKCKNGFFVHSVAEDADAEFSDLLADGMVFQSFYELLQFLNSHFPSDEESRKFTLTNRDMDLVSNRNRPD